MGLPVLPKLSLLLLFLVVLALACLGSCQTHEQQQQQENEQHLRGLTMVGGWTDVTNENSAEKESAVQFAIKKLEESNGVSESDTISVVSVKSQVVSGMNYAIEVKRRTDDGQCFIHDLVVYDVPWKHQMELTKNESRPC
eukprot:TRINITY_DN1302_c0_g1_i3.p2 TRINITY_DN1302_c0_g1~~TRINITY_DN1302_c0_g1_i3.p2  ORF type:complete len:140 (-),score=40.64 TRINITY_DN1302_c0_g1_i3:531-950(-)